MMGALVAVLPPLLLLAIGVRRTLRRGLNIADESYLVLGTLSFMKGQVPIRDFRAYDPGRYLYCAVFFKILGPGYVTTRIAMAVLSACSVVAIVFFVSWTTGMVLLATLSGCLSVIWMHPRYKQGEILLSVLFPISLLVLLNGGGGGPVACVIAITAIYAHNLAVYFIGSLFILAGAHFAAGLPFTEYVLSVASWLALFCATLVGLGALVPGYWSAFWHRKVRIVLRRGTANLPLPKLWIWGRAAPQINGFTTSRQLAMRMIFTVLPLIYVAVIGHWVATRGLSNTAPGNSLFVLALVGLPLQHHFWSRADLPHLTMIAQPMLLTSILIGAAILPPVLAILFAAALIVTSFSFLSQMTGFALSQGESEVTVPLKTPFETLMVAPAVAERLSQIKLIVEKHTPAGAAVLSVPINVAVPLLTNRPSAAYDCFPVYPSTSDGQAEMIANIKTSDPAVAVVGKAPVDGRQDLIFERNYAEVMAFLEDRYELLVETKTDFVYVRRAL